MRLLAVFAVLILALAAVAYGVEYAQGYNVNLPDMSNMHQSISDGFWGIVNHALDVLVDFIGKVLVKIANAILIVIHDLGFGGHTAVARP